MLCTVVLCSCNKEPEVTPTEAISIHTLPPTTAEAEPEWCKIDCDISLNDDKGAIVVSSEDFDTFALIGSNDNDCALRIKVTDTGADIMNLSYQQGVTKLSLNINGKKFADIALNEESLDGEFDIKGKYTFEQLCNWSNVIRGL